jgi:tetratricopeptide (TPR) repeat protein
MQAASAHGSLDESIQLLTEQLASHPGDHVALLERAKLYLEHGDPDLAMTDIGAAEVIAGKDEAAYVLGLYHLARNDYRAAIAAFSDYLYRYPSHVPSIHNRAIARRKLGLLDQSINDYRMLLEVSPKPSPDYYLELAAIEAIIEPHGLDTALTSLDRGIARLGLLVSLQNRAISYEIARGNYRGALRRHQTLQPWLGKTAQWRARIAQLTELIGAQNRREFTSAEPGVASAAD